MADTEKMSAEKSDCLCTMLWIILGIVVVAGVASFVMQRRKCSVSLSQQDIAEDIDPATATNLATSLASINEGMVCTMYHAHWCPHCKGMMDDIDALAKSIDGIRFVKVNAGDGNADVKTFCENNGITIKGFPHFVCTENGNIKWQDAGARSKEALKNACTRAFNLS